jgi:hypothetical protein
MVCGLPGKFVSEVIAEVFCWSDMKAWLPGDHEITKRLDLLFSQLRFALGCSPLCARLEFMPTAIAKLNPLLAHPHGRRQKSNEGTSEQEANQEQCVSKIGHDH